MEEQLLAPPPRRFTMKPALVVGAIAVLIVVVFSIGAALTHITPAKPSLSSRPSTVKGSSLKAISASAGLSVIERNGQPPNNVVKAISLPASAARIASANLGAGSTYDRQVVFSVTASQAAVLGFYQTELGHLGWRIVNTGAATRQPGTQIVGQIAGDDGFYWQLGVIVAPSTFGPTGTTDTTRFTLRLLQVGDQGS